MQPYATGARPSPFDVRTFTYKPSKAAKKGGARWRPEDIEDQHKVGICTAISMTMNARKARGIRYSADFQYLLQKKFVDKDWVEGSSALAALTVAQKYGLLPEEEWLFTKEADRMKSYTSYIRKLQAVPDSEIERLLAIAAQHKIRAYAKVPVSRDHLAEATDEAEAGLIVRFDLGDHWWTDPIEPLRSNRVTISGHLVNDTNYDGGSRRIANSWGADWADRGTAYYLLDQYRPTEAWIPYYGEVAPVHVEQQLAQRKALLGQLLDLVQRLIRLMQ